MANIQEIIKELSQKMDIITNQLNIIFDSVEKFKHKRHLIIYSYILGYYASKGNNKFNENILFDSLEILEKSLTRKTDLANLIIALSLSVNKCNEEEKKEKDEKNVAKVDVTETMLSMDPYKAYQDLFGETVVEKPLIQNKNANIKQNAINKTNKNHTNNLNNNINNNSNSNKINYNNQNNNNNINKNNNNINNINNINKNTNSNNNNQENIILDKEEDILNNKDNNLNKEKIENIDVINNKYNHNTHIIKKTNILNPQNTKNKKEINVKGCYNTINVKNDYHEYKARNYKHTTENIENKPKRIVKCLICSENFNELDKYNYKLDCNCIIHSKCFKKYLINSIKNNEIPVLCPKCKKEINSDIIYGSLNSIEEQKIKNIYENYCLDLYMKDYESNSDNIMYYRCPTPECNNYIPCKNNESKLMCPNCQNIYCSRCYMPWHSNKDCEDYDVQCSNNNIQLENDLNQNENKHMHNFQKCPKCQAIVAKEKGTNKILCFCGTSFCFKCGKMLREKHNCA